MTIKLPALIPDRNSASGFRVEYLSIEVDPELAKTLAVDEGIIPEKLTLWKMLRKHGVGLYAAQMICNDAMLNGVTLPSSSLTSNKRGAD